MELRERRQEETDKKRQRGEIGDTKGTERKTGIEKKEMGTGAKKQEKKGNQKWNGKRDRKRGNETDKT